MSYITNIPKGATFAAVYRTPPWVDEDELDRAELEDRIQGAYLRTSIACHYFNLCSMKGIKGRISIKQWKDLTAVACRKFVDANAEELFL
jgi:hypothetical protein